MLDRIGLAGFGMTKSVTMTGSKYEAVSISGRFLEKYKKEEIIVLTVLFVIKADFS